MKVNFLFGVINLAAVMSLVTTTPMNFAHNQAADLNPNPKQAFAGLLVPEFRADVTLNVGPSAVTGTLDLTQLNSVSPVLIQGTLTNLPPNTNHGFHVHQMGDIRGGCASTLAHYNPFGKNHGAPQDIFARHVGDLGNILADANGQAIVDITDYVISLHGPNSIIGRAFVLHELFDDLGRGGNPGSLVTGNSGNRIKCGIIGLAA